MNFHRRSQDLLGDCFVQHGVGNLRFLHSSVVESLEQDPALQPPVL
jgi:hypothetical protein